MANLRIKKKHLNPDAVDGTKLKLLAGESVRVVDAEGDTVDLVKLDENGNVVGNGFELAKKVDLDSEVSSRQAALSAEESARIAGDAAEASSRQAADESLQSALDTEESARIAADSALDARVLPIEKRYQVNHFPVYENNAQVYADGQPGVEDPSGQLRDGWYYTNVSAGQKINWYYFDGINNATVTLGNANAYAVVTFDGLGSMPILGVYTKPTGSGDVIPGFAHSKIAYSGSSSGLVIGKKYLVYFGENPSVHPELPRVQLVKSTSSSAGDQNPAEEVLTVSFGSNSAASAGSVKFMTESLGIWSASYKHEIALRIRHASQLSLNNEITARIADVNAEESRALAAEAALQSAIVAESSSRQAAIADLINSAPAVLDTLKELADALGGDDDFATTIANRFSNIESSLSAATQDGTDYTDLKHQEILDLVSLTLLKKEEVILTEQNITDGYVSLSGTEIIARSMAASIDRLNVFESEDFSLSVVDGVTRMTFLNSFASGGDEAVEAGEKLRLTYWSLD